MIQDCKAYGLSEILCNSFAFVVPEYQREYTWAKAQCEALFKDTIDNEKGYFLGSIICIKDKSIGSKYQLIDGQQRITTISLFLLALYYWASKSEETQEVSNLKDSIKSMLVDGKSRPLLTPQLQGQNKDDYFSLLSYLKLYDYENEKKDSHWKWRRIYKMFLFFNNSLKDYISSELQSNSQKDVISIIKSLLEKIKSLLIVFILVDSSQDAYMIFESLNNRGIPLSAIDLIKNSIIMHADSFGGMNEVQSSYVHWKGILKNLGEDYSIQERFFRQFYNAYRKELNDVFAKSSEGSPEKMYSLGYLATKSSMLSIYDKMIASDYKKLLGLLTEKSQIYSFFINPNKLGKEKLKNSLLDLSRIGGAPSYLLLLRLFADKETYSLKDEDLLLVINRLVSYFVRRNITDFPNTRNLNKIFMDIVSDINGKSGQDLLDAIFGKLKENSASDQAFEEKLRGQVYSDNPDATRFLLCSYENKYSTKEIHTDLWKRDKHQKYIWTIEHIFPEGDNIPECWIKMIGNGNKEEAKRIHDTKVHTLGNLTITGYNSNLGNKSFEEKKNRTTKKEEGITVCVGYNNGLMLNKDIVSKQSWTEKDIDERTDLLVKQFLEDYKLH